MTARSLEELLENSEFYNSSASNNDEVYTTSMLPLVDNIFPGYVIIINA